MDIKNNTLKLQELLEKANNLPDDGLWDIVQDYGNRTNYQSAFRLWGATEINPKHPIRTLTLYEMFSSCKNLIRTPEVEFIGTTAPPYSAFNSCEKLKEITFDVIVQGNSNNLFYCDFELETIKKVIFRNTITHLSNTFGYCYKLKNVVFEGELCMPMDTHWSTELSKASIIGLINVLSPNTSGITCTFSKTAVNKAFETSEGTNDGSTSTEWTTLVNSKSNWTISLV